MVGTLKAEILQSTSQIQGTCQEEPTSELLVMGFQLTSQTIEVCAVALGHLSEVEDNVLVPKAPSTWDTDSEILAWM